MDEIQKLTTGHVVSDVLLWSLVAVLVFFRAVEEARKWGLLPEKAESGGMVSAKNVGRLHVDSLKSILRHQIGDALNPVAAKMSEYNGRQLGQLEQINGNLIRMITILEERRQ